MTPNIRVRGLDVAFGPARKVLTGVELSVKEGESRRSLIIWTRNRVPKKAFCPCASYLRYTYWKQMAVALPPHP